MDDIDELLGHKFFKPPQLKVNPDTLNADLNQNIPIKYMEILLAFTRKIIFITASDYKNIVRELEQNFENELLELPPEMRKLAKLLYKTYAIGLQHGAVDYANSLIQSLEQKELLDARKD